VTSKILTLRVPLRVYGSLAAEAAKLGVPISAHARALIEQAARVTDFAQLHKDLLAAVADQTTARPPEMEQTRAATIEVLFLLRALCSETNPQLTGRAAGQLDRALGVDRPRI
jgi:hypothetical protein